MSDNNYQKVVSTPVKLNSEILEDGHQIESSVPSRREMLLGLGLFTFSIALYSVYCMLIKILLTSYQISVPEVNYYISLFLVIMFYAFAKQ